MYRKNWIHRNSDICKIFLKTKPKTFNKCYHNLQKEKKIEIN